MKISDKLTSINSIANQASLATAMNTTNFFAERINRANFEALRKTLLVIGGSRHE
jgi:hypothetical protein